MVDAFREKGSHCHTRLIYTYLYSNPLFLTLAEFKLTEINGIKPKIAMMATSEAQ